MPPLPRPTVMISRGMRKRCPVCGQGNLFRNWFQVRDHCPGCNLKLEQGEGAFLGSMAICYGGAGIAFFVFLAAWLILTLPDVQVWPLTIGSVIVVTIALLIFFPFSKTIWAGISVLLHDPADVDFGDAGRT